MELFDAVRLRRSWKLLVEPAPDDEQLEKILRAAACAPDHKQLRPWRFVIIEGEAKDELSRRWVDDLRSRGELSGGQIDKYEKAFGRAPMIIAVAAARIPTKLDFSELIGATDAAVQNLMLAATALGFGSIWRTGGPMTDEWLKAELGFAPDDQMVGLIYVGTVPHGAVVGERSDGLPEGSVRRYQPGVL